MAKMEMGWIKLYGLMKKYLPCAHSTPSSGSNYYQVSEHASDFPAKKLYQGGGKIMVWGAISNLGRKDSLGRAQRQNELKCFLPVLEI